MIVLALAVSHNGSNQIFAQLETFRWFWRETIEASLVRYATICV